MSPGGEREPQASGPRPCAHNRGYQHFRDSRKAVMGSQDRRVKAPSPAFTPQLTLLPGLPGFHSRSQSGPGLHRCSHMAAMRGMKAFATEFSIEQRLDSGRQVGSPLRTGHQVQPQPTQVTPTYPHATLGVCSVVLSIFGPVHAEVVFFASGQEMTSVPPWGLPSHPLPLSV